MLLEFSLFRVGFLFCFCLFFLTPPTHTLLFWRSKRGGGSLMSKSKPRALRKPAECNPAAIRHDSGKWGWGAERLTVFPECRTARGLAFDLFKASCLWLDGESWLLFVSEREREGGGREGGIRKRGGGRRVVCVRRRMKMREEKMREQYSLYFFFFFSPAGWNPSEQLRVASDYYCLGHLRAHVSRLTEADTHYTPTHSVTLQEVQDGGSLSRCCPAGQ